MAQQADLKMEYEVVNGTNSNWCNFHCCCDLLVDRLEGVAESVAQDQRGLSSADYICYANPVDWLAILFMAVEKEFARKPDNRVT